MERRPVYNDYGAIQGIDNPGYMTSSPSEPVVRGPPLAALTHDSASGEREARAATSAPKNLPAQPEWNITCVTEEDAHEAFISYASSKCCYSSAPAREGVITNLEPFNTYRYHLETFAEKRSIEWSHEPYTGQHVDALIQPAPELWAIEAKAPAFFKDQEKTIRVPHTSSVKNCHACNGMGTKPCKDCAGSGNKVCRACNGNRNRQGNTPCSHCNSCGKENCGRCSGNGCCECKTCRGKRQLFVFMTLKIQWTTYKNDFLVEQSSGLKSEEFSKVSGKEMFTDSQCMLGPMASFQDTSLSQVSERLIREHQSMYIKTSRILQQRHTIELIPVTKVTYDWKGKSDSYMVFGNENYVYTESYPATCCCSVM